MESSRAAREARCFRLQPSSCVTGRTREHQRGFLQLEVESPACRTELAPSCEILVGEGGNRNKKQEQAGIGSGWQTNQLAFFVELGYSADLEHRITFILPHPAALYALHSRPCNCGGISRLVAWDIKEVALYRRISIRIAAQSLKSGNPDQ